MSHTLSRRRAGGLRAFCLLAVVMAIWPLGCSKDEVTQAFNDAAAKTQELAAPVVKKIEAQLPESGSVTLQMTPSSEFNSASIEVIGLGQGRPNVVQVLTYDPSKRSRTFPCLMIHGTTTAASPSDLSGQKVPCELYFQFSATAPIAMTKPGSPVAVTFDRFDTENNALHATLGMVELDGADGKKISIRGGSLVAVVKSGGN